MSCCSTWLGLGLGLASLAEDTQRRELLQHLEVGHLHLAQREGVRLDELAKRGGLSRLGEGEGEGEGRGEGEAREARRTLAPG